MYAAFPAQSGLTEHKNIRNIRNNNKEIDDEGYYNKSEKKVNLSKMRATELPFNRRVYLPKPLEESEEVKHQESKTDIERRNRKIHQRK